MSLGIGLYAPCMILVSLLGMSPTAAFPIMMGSCAFLMPVGSLQFIRERLQPARRARPGARRHPRRCSSPPTSSNRCDLVTVRWLVIVVVVYTAVTMLAAGLSADDASGTDGKR